MCARLRLRLPMAFRSAAYSGMSSVTIWFTLRLVHPSLIEISRAVWPLRR